MIATNRDELNHEDTKTRSQCSAKAQAWARTATTQSFLLSSCLRVFVFHCCLLGATGAAAALPDVLPYGRDLPLAPVTSVNKTDPRLVQVLGRRLSDAHAPARAQALAEIGRCRLPAGLAFVRQGLSDADAGVRREAAKAAGLIGDASIVADLQKLVADSDARVRREVMIAAGALGAIDVVSAGLSDADATVVAAAVAVASKPHGPVIAKALPTYPQATQLLAIRALGQMTENKGQPNVRSEHGAAVAAMLESKSPAIRAAAVDALAVITAGVAYERVVFRLQDDHPTVRRAALLALRQISPTVINLSPDAHDVATIRALEDSDLSVRETAAGILVKYPTATAIDALVKNLPLDHARLHAAALDALVAIGQPAIEPAVRLLSDADPRRREDGSFILGGLKSDAGFDAHVKLVSDADWAVVKQAAESLGKIGRAEAAAPLTALVNRAPELAQPTTDFKTVQAKSEAIEQAIIAATLLGEKGVLPTCRKVAPDKKNYGYDIRCAAAYAIGRLGEARDAGVMTRIINDQEDFEPVKFEAVKALGHLKSSAAMKFVGTAKEPGEWPSDAVSQWLAYWVRWKLTGQDEPLSPRIDPWEAETSVRLLEP